MAKDYSNQRQRRTPPHAALGDIRMALGITLDEVCDRVESATGVRPERGTISAIENGHRGASAELLAALCVAYGMRDGALTTTYVPRERSVA